MSGGERRRGCSVSLVLAPLGAWICTGVSAVKIGESGDGLGIEPPDAVDFAPPDDPGATAFDAATLGAVDPDAATPDTPAPTATADTPAPVPSEPVPSEPAPSEPAPSEPADATLSVPYVAEPAATPSSPNLPAWLTTDWPAGANDVSLTSRQEANPDKPPAPIRLEFAYGNKANARKPAKWALILVIALAVILIIDGVVALTRRSNTPPLPAGAGWTGPLRTGVSNPYVPDLTLGDVILLQPFDNHQITAFDLAARKITFTVTPDDTLYHDYHLGDSTGFVTIVNGQIEAIDPTTGQIIGQAVETSSTAEVIWAGQGMILVEDMGRNTLCGRSMANPGTCLWQAPDTFTMTMASQQNAFGGGKWANTVNGVVDMATGQPASFGQDAGFDQTDMSWIFYTGDSPTRIFRVHIDQSGGISTVGTTTYQPWDITTDSPISPAVEADAVVTDPNSPVYTAVTSFQNQTNPDYNDTTTAYSWATGAQLWQMNTSIMEDSIARFVGTSYITVVAGAKGTDQLEAVDAENGSVTWQPNMYSTDFVGNIGNTVYAYTNDDVLVAYDASDGFAALWQSAPPKQSTEWCKPGVTDHFAYCYDIENGDIYLLNS